MCGPQASTARPPLPVGSLSSELGRVSKMSPLVSKWKERRIARERIHVTFPVQRHWDIGNIEAQAARCHLGISYRCKDARDSRFITMRVLIGSPGVRS